MCKTLSLQVQGFWSKASKKITFSLKTPRIFLFFFIFLLVIRIKYYKNILSLNSIFLPENFNIFHTSSLENILPITISGSIAIERSIAGYKTIYFGYPWWAGLPGTIHINEIKNLSNIKKYILHDKQISVSAINYLCKMLDNKTIVNSVNMHAIDNDINADNKHFANKIKEIIKKVT